MPITRIEVNEYECIRCGYKWINRVNGKDGPVPSKCANCKRSTWNGEAMRSREKGLRARVSNLGKFYQIISHNVDLDTSERERMSTVWDERLVDQFLNDLNPRPMEEELYDVLTSEEDGNISDFKLSVGGNFREIRHRYGRIEIEDPNLDLDLDPERSVYFTHYKWDPTTYVKLLISEAEGRKELIRELIRKRDIEPVDCSPDYIRWDNPRDVILGKGLLKLGRALEEEGTPSHKIYAKMVKQLPHVDKSRIERLCPAEWKPKQKQQIVATAPTQ